MIHTKYGQACQKWTKDQHRSLQAFSTTGNKSKAIGSLQSQRIMTQSSKDQIYLAHNHKTSDPKKKKLITILRDKLPKRMKILRFLLRT